MRILFRLLFVSCLPAAIACNPSGSSEQGGNFYPYIPLIKAEAEALDSMPLAVIRYREDGQGSDTSIVGKGDFRRMALEAFQPDITIAPLNELYHEEVFMDQTLNRVVIRYGTEDPDAEIRLLEISLDPDREKVKSIYLEKRITSGDTVQTAKTIWTVGRQLQVNRIRRVGGSPIAPLRERFVWGLTD